MSYAVKELVYTLQGEGARAGSAAVFCRFAGCNLWSGREEDRGEAICQFCDTDFLGVDGEAGGHFADAEQLAAAIAGTWAGAPPSKPLVVFTGGEPALQLDAALVEKVHENGFEVAIETNGTRRPPDGIDWVCVSPKAGAPLHLTSGSELKLVYPQADAPPEAFADLDFDHFFLQPMAGPALEGNMQAAVAYCLAHPQWRVSLQTHKVLGIA